LAKRKQAPAPKGRSAAKKKDQAQSILREIQDAMDNARVWLHGRGDYYTYLTRRDSLRGAPELARHLRGDLLARQGRDGSWGEGDLASSVEALWYLLDLGMAVDSSPVTRGLEWIHAQQDAEGAYGFGCTPARHDQGTCEHFLRGFFSPGSPDEAQEISLSNGQTVTSDVGARLLVSERTLRLVLRANASDSHAAASLSGLTALPLYEEYGGTFTPAVLVGALQALAWAGDRGDSRSLENGLETVAAKQKKDGTWPNVEFFFVLEMLLEARHALADRMFKRAVPRLLESQHKNGAWGRRHMGAQTWIAFQVLEQTLIREKGPGVR
jgi:hypothetical protein